MSTVPGFGRPYIWVPGLLVIDGLGPLFHVIEDNQLGKEDAGGPGRISHPERHGV